MSRPKGLRLFWPQLARSGSGQTYGYAHSPERATWHPEWAQPTTRDLPDDTLDSLYTVELIRVKRFAGERSVSYRAPDR